MLNSSGREISRQIKPTIQMGMVEAYRDCASMTGALPLTVLLEKLLNKRSGNGSFAKMKNRMVAHVNEKPDQIFDACTDHITGVLDKMLQHIYRGFKEISTDILTKIQDGFSVLWEEANQETKSTLLEREHCFVQCRILRPSSMTY